ncbi:hypothetical protein BpHYR1_013153 [Brachionus plicatilis]|uniref:Uncharacterized protein n=1 Tax=Brachionus plicatilis TaxID=10195 RepID=A0A3M7RR06_BRAPC|nr:hypothetical protein BpHYR1_013153 [Brachionus plicatilis]
MHPNVTADTPPIVILVYKTLTGQFNHPSKAKRSHFAFSLHFCYCFSYPSIWQDYLVNHFKRLFNLNSLAVNIKENKNLFTFATYCIFIFLNQFGRINKIKRIFNYLNSTRDRFHLWRSYNTKACQMKRTKVTISIRIKNYEQYYLSSAVITKRLLKKNLKFSKNDNISELSSFYFPPFFNLE